MDNIFTQLVLTPLTGCSRLVSWFNTLWIRWTYPFASIGKSVWIHYSCDLARNNAPYIVIGGGVSIGRNAWLNIPRPIENEETIIVVESRCDLGRRCTISARNHIQIEQNTMFGPSVFITDHNHGFEDVNLPIRDQGTTVGGKVRIGQSCWIGSGAAIVCGRGMLELGHHCVVAANAVVTRSFPAYSVIAGNPARVVKQFDPVKQVWVIGLSRMTETGP